MTSTRSAGSKGLAMKASNPASAASLRSWAVVEAVTSTVGTWTRRGWLRMAAMAHHDHLQPVLVVALGLDVDLAHKRAGGVDIDHLPPLGLGRDGLGNAMG